MKIVKISDTTGTQLRSSYNRYFAFADDVVVLCQRDDNIASFIKQLSKLEHVTSLEININKTKILLTDTAFNLASIIPDTDINNMLDKFYCEKYDRYSNASTSLKYHKAYWCGGAKNRSRTGTLAVAQGKLFIEEKLQPKADNILVNGDSVKAVKSYEYLRIEMDCQDIKVSLLFPKYPQLVQISQSSGSSLDRIS
eukprot:snap_masked-scaffold_1-processed-gene-14.18-mRNA-1 protein AED:1.00 eAED:1.00 QI:0/-1/0/0/-1/1/1/0/195